MGLSAKSQNFGGQKRDNGKIDGPKELQTPFVELEPAFGVNKILTIRTHDRRHRELVLQDTERIKPAKTLNLGKLKVRILRILITGHCHLRKYL